MSKAAAYYRSIKEDRDLWRIEKPQKCMCCGNTSRLEIHEIERRSHASNNWWHRSTALLLCQTCHAGPFAAMPHARQLAYKRLRDFMCFDLSAWLSLANRPLSYVTPDEVEAEMASITKGERDGTNPDHH